jgi:hypothetical protein
MVKKGSNLRPGVLYGEKAFTLSRLGAARYETVSHYNVAAMP